MRACQRPTRSAAATSRTWSATWRAARCGVGFPTQELGADVQDHVAVAVTKLADQPLDEARGDRRPQLGLRQPQRTAPCTHSASSGWVSCSMARSHSPRSPARRGRACTGCGSGRRRGAPRGSDRTGRRRPARSARPRPRAAARFSATVVRPGLPGPLATAMTDRDGEDASAPTRWAPRPWPPSSAWPAPSRSPRTAARSA